MYESVFFAFVIKRITEHKKNPENLHQNTLVKAFLRIDLSINFLPLVTIFLVEQKVRKLQKI